MKKSELKKICWNYYHNSDEWEKVLSVITDYEMADLLSNEINSCLEKMKKKELLKTIEQLEKETGQTISEVSDDE